MGDLLLMFAETSAAQSLTASGWTLLADADSGSGNAGSRLTVLYRVATGTDPTTTSDSGDHQMAVIIGIQAGTFDAADPFNAEAEGVDVAATTAISIPGATTDIPDCLVFAAVSGSLPDAVTTTEFSAWANASLASLTERVDQTSTAGDGSALGIASGVKVTAGAYDATTATAATGTLRGKISFAVNPSGAAPVNTVAPAVTGTPTEGHTLSCSQGTWDNAPTSYTYQWVRDTGAGFANIGGATASTYALVAGDRFADIRCIVTATNATGSTPANSNTVADIGPLYAGTLDAVGLELVPGEISGTYSVIGEGGGRQQRISIGIGIGL